MLLAALTSTVWGLAFVAMKFGLESFSAPQLTALRFLIASVPVLFVPRPRLPWASLVLIGLTLFAGQFLLLFFAFEEGLPPGLASVTQQMHVLLTVLLSAALAVIINGKRDGRLPERGVWRNDTQNHRERNADEPGHNRRRVRNEAGAP